MLHLVKLDRNCGPETIAAMTAAVGAVGQSLLMRINGNDGVRRRLALNLLATRQSRERDTERLSVIAVRQLTGTDRSASG
jgi:hypothetical protein